MLGIEKYLVESHSFLEFFSGNMSAFQESNSGDRFRSWATPYALSIYGEEMYRNCPFQNGNGYGDGRAISIAEVLVPESGRWELQIKGSGTTPFCRGGDGRAVLRSSVREFLASEALHSLGVSTTRGLSLIVSGRETADRPWFTATMQRIDVTDRRIAHLPLHQRKAIVKEVNSQPNAMISEHVAMACRVSPSFVRVGHIELFARRYRSSLSVSEEPEQQMRRRELRLMVEHFLFRECGGPPPNTAADGDSDDLQQRILDALRLSSKRISTLTAEWMRVGYCQGNFNSDNCLAAGRTMDFGPFGFIEKYEKLWNMWSGGGEAYGFRNQHNAGGRNFASLASAMALLLDAEGQREVKEVIIPSHMEAANMAVREVHRQKMGLLRWSTDAAAVFERMDDLMEEAEADYTLFWRQLARLPESHLLDSASGDDAAVVTLPALRNSVKSVLADVFYRELPPDLEERLVDVIGEWLALLQREVTGEADNSPARVAARMKRASPKYVPREWMLVDAYSAAARGDYSEVHRLQRLFQNPYDEQSEFEELYFRKTPAESRGKAGVATMT